MTHCAWFDVNLEEWWTRFAFDPTVHSWNPEDPLKTGAVCAGRRLRTATAPVELAKSNLTPGVGRTILDILTNKLAVPRQPKSPTPTPVPAAAPGFAISSGSVASSFLSVVVANHTSQPTLPAISSNLHAPRVPVPSAHLLQVVASKIALRNINILQKHWDALANKMRVFCKCNDLALEAAKVEKLGIILRLAMESNVDPLLSELYGRIGSIEVEAEVDVDFVRRSIKAIGQTAIDDSVTRAAMSACL
ncbi:uncharacterized protein BXZ73DRAFT_101994 [Epithele typhae]|uniref:uncharacterized protein n=1 Tax=Epithele typhae TaxID=378194 RepID=UPI002007A55F|nr:uncharacterized protein BXZ73DRAFT_101994 [Epithele typhae]KAH9929932.1 hypothetical protein BXZ73DRAFT_101994 [Epithele typhae]